MCIQIKKHHFLLVAFIISSNLFSQEAPYGSLGLRRIYQSTLINPALVPDSTCIKNSLSFVPFLPLSIFDFGASADMGAITLGKFTSAIEGGKLNLNTVVANMNDSKNSNSFAGINISSLHVYLKVGKKGSRLEFSQRLKMSASTNMINKNLFEALINTISAKNTVIDLSDAKSKIMAWNEIAVGYTRPINNKWTLGGRFKYLNGVAYSDFSSTKLTAKIGPDGNSFDIDSKIRTASLNPLSDTAYNNQDLTKYKNNNLASLMLSGLGKNNGLGLDAGVNYEIQKGLNVFAGFNDLGFISWKNNPLTYDTKVLLTDFYPLKKNPVTNNYEANFDAFTENGLVTPESFTVALNTQFNIGTTWKPVKWFHSTALIDAYLVNGSIQYPGITVAGTLNGGNFSEFTMNAGYTQNKLFRIGTGMSIKAGVLQMHLFSNNITGLFNTSNIQAVDFQFGLSWAWTGQNKKTS